MPSDPGVLPDPILVSSIPLRLLNFEIDHPFFLDSLFFSIMPIKFEIRHSNRVTFQLFESESRLQGRPN